MQNTPDGGVIPDLDAVSTVTKLLFEFGPYAVAALCVAYIYFLIRALPKMNEETREILRPMVRWSHAFAALMLAATIVFYVLDGRLHTPKFEAYFVGLPTPGAHPAETTDPPRVEVSFQPLNPYDDIAFSRRLPDPQEPERYTLQVHLDPAKDRHQVRFVMTHRFRGWEPEAGTSVFGQVPGQTCGRVKSGHKLRCIPKRYEFTIDLTRGEQLTFAYGASDDPRVPGTLHLKDLSGGDSDEPISLAPLAGAAPRHAAGAGVRLALADTILGLLGPGIAYAQSRPPPFRDDGSYEVATVAALRDRLATDQIWLRRDAEDIVVAGGDRSLKFIADSLATEVVGGFGDRAPDFVQSLARVVARLSEEGTSIPQYVRVALAEAWAFIGDYAAAAEEYGKTRDAPLADAGAYFRRAYTLHVLGDDARRAGDPEAAAGLYQESLVDYDAHIAGGVDADPQTGSRALSNRSIVHYRLGDLERARDDALRAAETAPEPYSSPLNNLAYYISESSDDPGQLQEALALARRALEISPDNPNIQDTVGWIALKLGNCEDALRHLQAAVDTKVDPEYQAHLEQAQRTCAQ